MCTAGQITTTPLCVGWSATRGTSKRGDPLRQPIIPGIRRSGRLYGALLFIALAQQACFASGSVNTSRSSPEYAIERYLQPCKTAGDCAARQLCLSNHCTCPYVIGLTGAPQCTTMSLGAWILVCWVLFLGVLELGLAYLHILNLKAHWTQPLAPVSSRVLPSSASFTSSQAALRQTKSSSSTTHPPARRPLCEVLFTFKSLFSLFSLVFCLAPLAFCGTTVLMLFFPHSDLHALYSSTWAVEVVVLWVSFFAVTHAYLFMGELWLDAASRFRFGSFIGSRLSKLLLHLPSFLLLLLILWYSAIGNTVLGVYLTSVVGLVITAILATSFLVLGASIMIPVIRARALMAKSGGNLDKAFAQAGYANNAGGEARTRRGSLQSAARDQKAVVRWLRNKRNARFKPELAKISEADSSALEESSSAGYIGKTDRANEKNADGAKGPQARLMGMAAFKGSFVAVDHDGRQMGSQRNLPTELIQEQEEQGETPGLLEEAGATARTLGAIDYESLARHIAYTAMKVSGASLLSVVAYVGGCLLLRHADAVRQDPLLGSLSTVLWYVSFPLCHLYGNLVCLLVISKEARGAVRPLQWAVACLLTCLCGMLFCGITDDDAESEAEEGAARTGRGLA